jgi:transposase
MLRAYFRQRGSLVRYRCSHQQHMEKAHMQLNLQLHHVVKDITSLTARRIMDAILSAERDPEKLATLRDRCCKETEATIAAALDGNYQEEHLSGLQVSVEMFDAYSATIREYELAG